MRVGPVKLHVYSLYKYAYGQTCLKILSKMVISKERPLDINLFSLETYIALHRETYSEEEY